MKRLCVIGNSQVGALKRGFDQLRAEAHPVCELYSACFWSLPGGDGPCIQVHGSTISALPERRHEVKSDLALPPDGSLDLAGFDAVLLAGVGIHAIRRQHHSVLSRHVVAGFIDDVAAVASGQQVVSRAVFARLAAAYLQQLPCVANIAKIAAIGPRPILVQTFPLPTSRLVEQADFDFAAYGRGLPRFLAWYHRLQVQRVEAHGSGADLRVLRYPDAWCDSGFTPDAFGNGKDAWHMGPRFGRWFMGQLLPQAWLGVAPESAAV